MTAEQLDLQALHRVRERLVGQRTGVINQISCLSVGAWGRGTAIEPRLHQRPVRHVRDAVRDQRPKPIHKDKLGFSSPLIAR
jgi:hypothetical protein